MSEQDGIGTRSSGTVSGLSSGDELIVTYRTLRVALLGAVVLLAFSIKYEIFFRADGDLLGSISAYFHTPARSIFVGSLIAIGMSVIAIRGVDDDEDAGGRFTRNEELYLNIAGMLAPIVALVPVAPPGEDRLPDDLIEQLKNNMTALIAVGILATLALWLWPSDAPTDPGRREAVRRSLTVYTAVIIVGAGVFVVWESARPAFHYVAAIAMFGCFGVVAKINWRRSAAGRYRTTYAVVTVGMAAAAVVIGGYKLLTEWPFDVGLPVWHTSVFWLEVIEIVLFAGFWIAQTAERWGSLAGTSPGTR